MTARVFDHGFPGVTIWPIEAGTALHVELDASPPPRDPRIDAKVEATWSRLTAANPRLFDGPILSLTAFDPATGRVACRRDSFKRLTVQGDVETGVVLLAVNGLVTARDRAGTEHVLMGRRSPGTRMYGGMWELTPAGGLEPPAGGAEGDPPGLPVEHLLRQLSVEMREEAGMDAAVGHAAPVAFYRDQFARSFNIVFGAALTQAIEDVPLVERDWDCDAVLWLPRSEAEEFGRKMPIIAPSRGLLRMAGWLP